MPASLLIADPSELARAGLRQALQRASSAWRVVAEAATVKEAWLLAKLVAPRIAIVDTALPGGASDLCEKLLRANIGVVVYAASPVAPPEFHRSSATRRPQYVSKQEPVSSIVNAVTALAAELKRRPLAFATHNSQRVRAILSRREAEVAAKLAAGQSNKEISSELGISIRTVESHRDRIRRKLGVDSIGQLARRLATDQLADSNEAEADNAGPFHSTTERGCCCGHC